MLGTILLVACTAMQLCVFTRVASVPVVRRHVPLRWLIVAGVVLWAALVAARLVAHGEEGTTAAVLELLGMDWMAMLFLAYVALLAVDLVTEFGLVLPRLAPALRGWALAAPAGRAASRGDSGGPSPCPRRDRRRRHVRPPRRLAAR